MKRKHTLGMICGYYLSRFDREAYANLGYGSQAATHQELGKRLGVPSESVKNWRDEFDPVHDNPRQGWHKREMYPSRRRVIEAFGDLSHSELLEIVKHILETQESDVADQLIELVDTDDDLGNERRGNYGIRGPTGTRAERLFREFHEKFGRPVCGKLTDRRDEQCGFDFLIEGNSHRLIAVEVKGLAGKTGGITFTDKEWRTAKEWGDSYYLALVRNLLNEPELMILRNPAGSLEASMRAYTVLQVGWSVSQAELRSVGADFEILSGTREPSEGDK